MGNKHSAGPDEAVVISGGCCRAEDRKYIIGGWGWAWWFVSDVERMSLEIMTLNSVCKRVKTSEGVRVTVRGVVECAVFREQELFLFACREFLGKSPQYVESVILPIVENCIRGIVESMSVEDINRDRHDFAAWVSEKAISPLGRTGIEILSFTLIAVEK